jgi:hypothetical protein
MQRLRQWTAAKHYEMLLCFDKVVPDLDNRDKQGE